MADNTINDYAQLIGKIEKEFTTTKAKEQVGSSSQVDFADVLDNAVKDVVSAEKQANQEIQNAIVGPETNVHQTLIAAEKADLSFQMMMSIRNKLMDAYNELMRVRV